jgi:hypothetical protein
MDINTNASLQRWYAAHQIFFVIVAGLNLAHTRLEMCLNAQDDDGISENLRLCTGLLIASAAAFHLAGDFEKIDDYENVVRPTLPEGFTGLYSADHAVLMGILKRLRPQLNALQDNDSFRFDHCMYLQAMNASYESHRYVCEQFVHDKNSLAGTSGAQSLRDHFRVRALSNAGCPMAKKS